MNGWITLLGFSAMACWIVWSQQQARKNGEKMRREIELKEKLRRRTDAKRDKERRHLKLVNKDK